MLVENLNVLQNIFLGRELCKIQRFKIWPKEGLMLDIAERFLASYEIPTTLIHELPKNLSNEQKQITAIARALLHPCKLLLLDDALASLNFQRQQKLLDHIKQFSAQNGAVIVNSDDLKNIFAVTNRILVLYQGKQIALKTTSETTPREIVELIVGSARQEQVTPVIWAFENYHAAQKQAEELRQTQQVLMQNLEAQDSLNRQLIERMRNQLQALDHLNLALQDANRRLMTEREAERKSLARELHDQVIQDLLSFNYQLESVENEIPKDIRTKELASIRDGIRQVVGSLRQICSDLRPPTIDSHGLATAIRSLAHEWAKQSKLPVELDIDPEIGRLPEPIELSIFRIVQEGLSNVRKHAKASNVKLSLMRTPSTGLMMKIEDDGRGIDNPVNLTALSQKKHFGLIGISERVSLLGGTMKVEPSKAGGLSLIIEIPSPYPILNS